MKKAFLLLCAVLLVLGSVLPLAGYRLAETVWGRRAAAPPSPPPESAEPAARNQCRTAPLRPAQPMQRPFC